MISPGPARPRVTAPPGQPTRGRRGGYRAAVRYGLS